MKILILLVTLLLGTFPKLANAGIITEVWDIRFTQAPGRYGLEKTGSFIQLVSTYNATGVSMDYFEIGRLCLDGQPDSRECQQENMRKSGYLAMSNAMTFFPNLFDINKALDDGMTLDTRGYLPADVYFKLNEHDNFIAGYQNSVSYQAYFNEYRGDSRFIASLLYQHPNGNLLNQRYVGTMRLVSRDIITVDEPPVPTLPVIDPPTEPNLPGAPVSVSEPGAATLFGLGLFLLLSTRRQK